MSSISDNSSSSENAGGSAKQDAGFPVHAGGGAAGRHAPTAAVGQPAGRRRAVHLPQHPLPRRLLGAVVRLRGAAAVDSLFMYWHCTPLYTHYFWFPFHCIRVSYISEYFGSCPASDNQSSEGSEGQHVECDPQAAHPPVRSTRRPSGGSSSAASPGAPFLQRTSGGAAAAATSAGGAEADAGRADASAVATDAADAAPAAATDGASSGSPVAADQAAGSAVRAADRGAREAESVLAAGADRQSTSAKGEAPLTEGGGQEGMEDRA